MILPFETYLQIETLKRDLGAKYDIKNGEAITWAHESKLADYCGALSDLILQQFRDGQQPAEGRTRAVAGYARPLARILRHVDLDGRPQRRERIQAMLLRGAEAFSIKRLNAGFAPAPIELVIASGYILAYPGGVDLYALAPMGWIDPGRTGCTPEGFRRICDSMDRWWQDSAECARRMTELGRLENQVRPRSQLDDMMLAELRKTPDYLRTTGYKLWEKWNREGPDGEWRWKVFEKWFKEGRAAVVHPEERRRSRED